MTLLFTILTLALLGLTSAVILYFVAQKFMVLEDARIDLVAEALPGANCGGCGYAGCRNFSEALVNTNDASKLFCPVGGNKTMSDIAAILGREAVKKDPLIAVIRCNGTPDHRPKTNHYDGAASCIIEHALYTGETGCPNGCLGQGDCTFVCQFGAISMNKETGLPEVIDEKCTSCGACVKACPRNIIELRKKQNKDRKIYVSCMNQEKGGIAKKYFTVACIGCEKCFKVCQYDAIIISNNLAFIDSTKCKLCRKCVTECPTNSILEINFPQRKTTSENTIDAAEVAN
jgi:Na+-translocating ferredoxin:NAD+ oxidoreductase RNF subunit RnfB